MISILTLAAFPLLQEPSDKPSRQKPLVPAPEGFQPRADDAGKPKGPQVMAGPGVGNPAGPSVFSSGTGPRAESQQAAVPFHGDRPLLRIDGVVISSAELNQMVRYYRTFRSGSDDLLLQDAVKALLPVKTMEAHFADQLPVMHQRIEMAREAVRTGTEFAAVVSEYSQDTEAPTEDGRYTFGREVAVQPFDRISHSTGVDMLSESFLTVYGYHFLEVVGYERGDKPQDDKTTVRHVLVMFPELAARDQKGEEIRPWIKQLVKDAKIEVLEPGLKNLVPPENRSQVLGG
ncbi:MAG: peptidylprolyl isomerase [Planctomycetota bacterium]|jgi:hypothetical protein